ncbi:uncharacterized protein O3C94_019001 [Discoglossus pictus]
MVYERQVLVSQEGVSEEKEAPRRNLKVFGAMKGDGKDSRKTPETPTLTEHNQLERRQPFNMFSVLWSDQNEILIYRTFDDFKKLNRQLRKKFPLEAGFFKKSKDIFPKLRDVPIFRKNKAVSRCIERLRLAEKYSQELLKIDEKISQCNLVIEFFTPKKEDRPSPMTVYYVSKTYEATSSDEIPVSIGVLVEVIEKSNTGWWLVSYNNKTVYVPSMFLNPYRSYQKLQTLLNQSKFTSTPNLFNSTSAAGPTLLAPRTRNQEEPCVSSNKSTDMRLHRKRSRSLSGLPSKAHSQLALELNNLARANVVKKTQSPPTEWKPKPMERKKGPSPSSSFESDEPVLLKRTMERPLRRHITTDLSDKDNYPEISIEYPKTQPMPSPPQVPQRPKPHEILHKCTTVTKQALQSAGSDI